jgi:hypothetical protein
MSGAYFGGVGYVEDENIYDDTYIRRDTLDLAGQLISFDQNTQEIGVISAGPTGYVLSSDGSEPTGLKWVPQSGDVIAAGVPAVQTGSSRLTIVDTGPTTTLAIATTGVGAGSVGGPAEIPVITYSDTGQILAVGTAAAVNAGSSGAETGTSGLTIGPSSVALALSGAAAGVYGNATTIPQITIDGRGRILAAVNQAITFPAITGGVSGAQTGTSGLTIVGNALAVANSGVAANSYGDATNVATFTVNAQGRLTAAASVPINFPAAADQLASVPVRNWGAGSSRVLGAADNVAVGDNAQVAPTSTEAVAIGRNSLAQTLGISVGNGARSTATNSTIIAPLSIAGASSCLFAGGNISSIAQTAAATGTIGLGFNLFGNLTSGSNNIAIAATALQNITTGSQTISIGNLSGQTMQTGGLNVFVGVGANSSTTTITQGTAIGANTLCLTQSTALGASCQANGVGSLVAGFQSAAGGVNSIAIGRQASVGSAANAGAIGNNIINTLANSMLMGSDVNGGLDYIVRSSGYLRSRRQLTACAGQIAPAPLQVFGPATDQVDLNTTFFDFFPVDGASSIELTSNRIFLGTLTDRESTFLISANLKGTVASNAEFTLTCLWSAPGLFINTANAAVKMTCGPGETNNLTLSTHINVPAASTGRNYIEFAVSRQSTTGLFTTESFRACITRAN